jgi:hypothetical protein
MDGSLDTGRAGTDNDDVIDGLSHFSLLLADK